MDIRGRWSSQRIAAPGRVALSVLLAGSGILVLAVEPWHGAVLLAASPTHGLDVGDLPAVVLLALAAWGAPGASVPSRWRRWRQHAAARAWPMALAGAVLVLAVLVPLATQVRANSFTDLLLVALVAAGNTPLVLSLRSESLVPLVAITGGWLADAALQPSGTTFGPALLVIAVATMGPRRSVAPLKRVIALALVAASVLSLIDVAGIDVLMAQGGGGPARTAALGLVLLSVAVTWPCPAEDRPRRHPPAASGSSIPANRWQESMADRE